MQLAAGTFLLEGTAGDGFAQPRLSFDGTMQNVALSGAGSGQTTLVLDAALGSVVYASGTSGLSLSGFSVACQRTPYTLGVVESLSASNVAVLSYDPSLYPVDLALYPWLANATAIFLFDTVANRFSLDVAFTSHALTWGPSGTVTLSLSAYEADIVADAGASLILVHSLRSGVRNAIEVRSIAGAFSVDDVVVHCSGEDALFVQDSANPSVTNFSTLRPSGYPMSSNSDAVRISNPSGAVLVADCVLEGQGDDGLDISSFYLTVLGVSSDRLTLTVHLPKKNSAAVLPGDSIQAFSTVDFSAIASLSVAAFSVVDGKGVVALASPAPAGVAVNVSALSNARYFADFTTVTNNIFRDNRGRGALLKQSNLYAAGNTFLYQTMAAVQTDASACVWHEGHAVSNWTLTRNSFEGILSAGPDNGVYAVADVYINNDVRGSNGLCHFDFSASPINYGLTITNNTFSQEHSQPAVAAFAVQGLTVSGNTVSNSGEPGPVTFACTGCADTSITANGCDAEDGCAVAVTPFPSNEAHHNLAALSPPPASPPSLHPVAVLHFPFAANATDVVSRMAPLRSVGSHRYSGSLALRNSRKGVNSSLEYDVSSLGLSTSALSLAIDINLATAPTWTQSPLGITASPRGTDSLSYLSLLIKSNGYSAYSQLAPDDASPTVAITALKYSSPQPAAGAWRSLVAVINGTGVSRLYVDGSVAQTFSLPSIASVSKLWVGQSAQYAGQAFNGAVKEARVWPFVLSAEQVAALSSQQ